MKEAKFKIGDLVETNWIGVGKVSDIMYSTVRDQYTYEVCNEDGASDLFTEDCLKAVPKKKDYSMDIKIDIASNVVIATLYESVGGGTDTHQKGTRPPDPRWCRGYCPGCQLRLHETVQEHGRV